MGRCDVEALRVLLVMELGLLDVRGGFVVEFHRRAYGAGIELCDAWLLGAVVGDGGGDGDGFEVEDG